MSGGPRPLSLGFTGTREGMSGAQQVQLAMILTLCADAAVVGAREMLFHQGGAKGADNEAWDIAADLGYTIVYHFLTKDNSALDRHRDIVVACDLLIAAPLTDLEALQSGTWATVRYARQVGKPVVLLSRGAA